MLERRVLWTEEAPLPCDRFRGGPLEDNTMPGWVSATVTKHLDQSVDVHPEFTPTRISQEEDEKIQDCPIKGDHRVDTPRCYTIQFDGVRRACPYWVACTAPSNITDRQDAGVLALRLSMHGSNISRCGVICNAARRNRPPGC